MRGEGQGTKKAAGKTASRFSVCCGAENRPFVEPYLKDSNSGLQASGPVSYMVDWNRDRGMHSFQLLMWSLRHVIARSELSVSAFVQQALPETSPNPQLSLQK